MNDQEKILQFLKMSGPTFPTKVAKNIGQDTLIASAYLSDLKAQGKVKISDLKIGASPLYYLPGQESELYKFVAGNVNPKNLQVLENLKEKQILRENNLDLLSKVALRSLKDFAIPLQVTVRGNAELFWKWYLMPAEEANQIIGTLLAEEDNVQEEVSVPEPIQEQQTKLEINSEELVEKDVAVLNEENNNVEIESNVEEKKVVEEISEPEVVPEEESLSEEPKLPKKEIEPEKEIKESKPEIKEEKKIKQNQKDTENVTEKKEKNKEEKEELTPERVEELKEEKKNLIQKVKDKIMGKSKNTDQFLPTVDVFFTNLDINKQQVELVRKNSEINFLIDVPSVVGKIKYFCKAKRKIRCDEKDLAAAYMEAQIKKLPLLFLFSNEITKKAEEMIESGAFENVIVKKIE